VYRPTISDKHTNQREMYNKSTNKNNSPTFWKPKKKTREEMLRGLITGNTQNWKGANPNFKSRESWRRIEVK